MCLYPSDLLFCVRVITLQICSLRLNTSHFFITVNILSTFSFLWITTGKTKFARGVCWSSSAAVRQVWQRQGLRLGIIITLQVDLGGQEHHDVWAQSASVTLGCAATGNNSLLMKKTFFYGRFPLNIFWWGGGLFVWTEGLKLDILIYCTNCKALWGSNKMTKYRLLLTCM